jgi:hypothetical protein
MNNDTITRRDSHMLRSPLLFQLLRLYAILSAYAHQHLLSFLCDRYNNPERRPYIRRREWGEAPSVGNQNLADWQGRTHLISEIREIASTPHRDLTRFSPTRCPNFIRARNVRALVCAVTAFQKGKYNSHQHSDQALPRRPSSGTKSCTDKPLHHRSHTTNRP